MNATVATSRNSNSIRKVRWMITAASPACANSHLSSQSILGLVRSLRFPQHACDGESHFWSKSRLSERAGFAWNESLVGYPTGSLHSGARCLLKGYVLRAPSRSIRTFFAWNQSKQNRFGHKETRTNVQPCNRVDAKQWILVGAQCVVQCENKIFTGKWQRKTICRFFIYGKRPVVNKERRRMSSQLVGKVQGKTE